MRKAIEIQKDDWTPALTISTLFFALLFVIFFIWTNIALARVDKYTIKYYNQSGIICLEIDEQKDILFNCSDGLEHPFVSIQILRLPKCGDLSFSSSEVPKNFTFKTSHTR